MKRIKITLAIVVLATIGSCVWYFLGDQLLAPKQITPPRNELIDRIKKEIDSLQHLPSNAFSKEFYKGIQYRINEYHKLNFLGDNKNDNTQWQQILSKNLYSAYAPKFVEQALYVFNNSEWKIADLTFIRSEVIVVQSSTYLEKGSPVDNSLKNIRNILSKYDEIAAFISSCNNVMYSTISISSSFPIAEVTSKIQKSRTYLTNNLDNSYVNHCIRLKAGLKEIPQNLFYKHVNYLQSKIQYFSGKYINCIDQPAYSSSIYTPLQHELNELDNEIYAISDNIFDSNYSSLESKLNADNTNAYKYFLTKK